MASVALGPKQAVYLEEPALHVDVHRVGIADAVPLKYRRQETDREHQVVVRIEQAETRR
jgi:hypothetical protein